MTDAAERAFDRIARVIAGLFAVALVAMYLGVI